MSAYADDCQIARNRPITNSISNQNKAYPVHRLADNRSETVRARELQAIADGFAARHQPPVRKKTGSPLSTSGENKNRLPDDLIAGIYALSGRSLQDVELNFNSSKPAAVNAEATTQGNRVEVTSGREKDIPHEAWHVVQQREGRVKPTRRLNGFRINDDPALEREADMMGAKVLDNYTDHLGLRSSVHGISSEASVTQCKVYMDVEGRTVKKEQPTGNDKIDDWIKDDIHRHFLSAQELTDYQSEPRKTEHIGTLGPNHSWIRLNQNRLLVVGEVHNQITMQDMVAALNNRRYMDEGYSFLPDHLHESFPELMACNKSPNSCSRHLEHPFPKTAFSLTYIHNWRNYRGKADGNAYDGGQTLANTFHTGLKIAQDVYNQRNNNSTPVEQALANKWQQWSNVWLQMIEDIESEDNYRIGGVIEKNLHQITPRHVMSMVGRIMDFLLEADPDASPSMEQKRNIRTGVRRWFPRYNQAKEATSAWREAY